MSPHILTSAQERLAPTHVGGYGLSFQGAPDMASSPAVSLPLALQPFVAGATKGCRQVQSPRARLNLGVRRFPPTCHGSGVSTKGCELVIRIKIEIKITIKSKKGSAVPHRDDEDQQRGADAPELAQHDRQEQPRRDGAREFRSKGPLHSGPAHLAQPDMLIGTPGASPFMIRPARTKRPPEASLTCSGVSAERR